MSNSPPRLVQWQAVEPALEALPPVRAEVVSCAGAKPTAWWVQTLLPALEPDQVVALALSPATGGGR
jgi:ABC-type sulfate transport system permease component